MICTVVSACVAAYGFGRFDFPGRKLMFNIMLATLFLPQVVLNVPQYLLYNKFGWLDSPFYLAIWVHCAFAVSYTHLDVYKRQVLSRPSTLNTAFHRTAIATEPPRMEGM